MDWEYTPQEPKESTSKDSVCWKNAFECFDANCKKLLKLDEKSKKAKQLLGRVLWHPIADGRAAYQVINVTAKKVIIRVCTGIGDDWTIPAWGHQALLDKDFVVDYLKRQDGLNALFSR